jgi:hypothetical protein
MSRIQDQETEQFNRLALDSKIKDLEQEITTDKFANNFSMLELDYYEEEERAYKIEVRHQFDGFVVFNI